MFFSTTAAACVLSLLSSTHALALVERQSNCCFVCPKSDVNGSALSTSTEIGVASFSCTYSGESRSSCLYDLVSVTWPMRSDLHLPTLLQSTGVLVGNNWNGNCPQQAASQCPANRRRGDDDDKPSNWKSAQPPSWSPNPYDPTPSW